MKVSRAFWSVARAAFVGSAPARRARVAPPPPAVDETAMPVDRAVGVAAFRWAAAVGALWFVITFASILWSWGGSDPLYFASPDEAVDRRAAGLVATQGSPALRLPGDDPEDLRHGRLWVSLNDEAIPSYPPLAYYIQGALLVPAPLGATLVAGLSAAGVAAFAAAVSLLGAKRQWIAFMAPLAAFPAFYWLLRPWINMATFLVSMSFAFLFWVLWRRSHSTGWLIGAATMAALAAGVRPDYALFVLLIGALSLVAEMRPGEGRNVTAAVIGTLLVAVGLNLLLNWMTTGDPLQPAYEIADSRRVLGDRSGLPGPVLKLRYALLPYGIPAASEVLDQIRRFWFLMGPVALITVGFVALVPLLRETTPRRRLVYTACVVVCAGFVLTHVSDAVYGSTDSAGELRHSVARYWAPVYLLAALPLLLLAMARVREGIWVAAAAVLLVIAFAGARDVYQRQPESLSALRDMQAGRAAAVERWSATVPPNAVVYSYNLDKIVWPHWEIATLSPDAEHDRTAASIERTIEGGSPVYVVQMTWPDTYYADLTSALESRGLRLQSVDWKNGVFLVEPESATAKARSSSTP